MSKFQIDLRNYPELLKLFDEDRTKFGSTMSKLLIQTDQALEKGRFDHAARIYKMGYLDMMQALSDTFFDVEGIAQKHHSKAEIEGLKGLGGDLHPLAIFTSNAPVYNADGENMAPKEWLQMDYFNLKDWLYALFYGARFVSWHDLAEYLMLGEYELIDALKVQNLEHLLDIQPALRYQKINSIPTGKLIPGTGLFSGGDSATRFTDKCKACNSEWHTEHPKYGYCSKCRLGGLK